MSAPARHEGPVKTRAAQIADFADHREPASVWPFMCRMLITPTRVASIAAALCFCLASQANAAPAPGAGGESADEQAKVSQDVYVFGIGDKLEGEVLGPTGTHVTRRPGQRHPSLIKLRVAFTDRLAQHTRDM